MGKKLCKYCGEYIQDDSRFCYYCGSSVESEKEPQKSVLEKENIYSHTIKSEYVEPTKGISKTKVKRKIVSGVILAFIIIGAIGIILPVTFISIYGPLKYRYLGTTDFSSGILITSNATVTVNNFDGDVNIIYNSFQIEVLTANIEVYGRSEANILDAETFTIDFSGEKVEFIFDSGEVFNFWDKTAMKYTLNIELNPHIDFDYDIETFSGNIGMDLISTSGSKIDGFNVEAFSGDIDIIFDSNIEIIMPIFYVKTSSGSIDLVFTDNNFINCSSFYVEAFSGDIYVAFDNSNELIATTFDLISSSGKISIDFGYDSLIITKSMNINCFSGDIYLLFGSLIELVIENITIDLESGEIEIDCDGCIFQSNITWIITAFSGDVDIYLDPVISPGINYTADFTIDVYSGSIDIEYGFNENDVGVQIIAETTSGYIDLPNDLNFYQSINFNLKAVKYLFDLSTFSGDIDVFGFY